MCLERGKERRRDKEKEREREGLKQFDERNRNIRGFHPFAGEKQPRRIMNAGNPRCVILFNAPGVVERVGRGRKKPRLAFDERFTET